MTVLVGPAVAVRVGVKVGSGVRVGVRVLVGGKVLVTVGAVLDMELPAEQTPSKINETEKVPSNPRFPGTPSKSTRQVPI